MAPGVTAGGAAALAQEAMRAPGEPGAAQARAELRVPEAAQAWAAVQAVARAPVAALVWAAELVVA